MLLFWAQHPQIPNMVVQTRWNCLATNRPHLTSYSFHLHSPWCVDFHCVRERLASSLITDCLYMFFFWTPPQQMSASFNQHCVSVLLSLFTVFIARVYANGFLLCCGSMPNCSVIGPNDEHWLTIMARLNHGVHVYIRGNELECLTVPTAIL